MRLKFSRKVIISSLSLLAGASVIGSITSTVAWFQYATKAQLAYTGTTTHCSKLLKIAVKGNGGAPGTWGNHLGMSDLPSDTKFAPITTGAQLKDAALPTNFYAQPNPKQGAYDSWLTADSNNYVQFTVFIKVNDGDTGSPQLVNDVFLTDVTIQDASSNSGLDLSNAIRVHLATTYEDEGQIKNKYFLFAKETTSTDVGGYLDLDSDGEYDTKGYSWDDKIIYGEATKNPDDSLTPAVQESYSVNDPTDHSIIAAVSDKGELSQGTSIGKTSAANNHYLEVKVTIWLEGWAMLHNGVASNADPTDTQVWDNETYTNKKFNVGLTFGVQLHSDADHE